MSLIDYLNLVLPGQADDWYKRIARDILDGKMPLPTIEGVPVPEALAPIKPEGTCRSGIPDTVGEALHQARQKPKRPTQPAKASTKCELERLVHSDRAAADRLAAQVAFANPGQSEQWCWEKAIFDLERDRH